MASSVIAVLDEILQSLPAGSREAQRLTAVIRALEDALPIRPDVEFSKLAQELAAERRGESKPNVSWRDVLRS